MTKQHFTALAQAIASQRTAVAVREQTRRSVAIAIADACAQFNPGFKKDKFLESCNLSEEQ